jgi:hypothetical protein
MSAFDLKQSGTIDDIFDLQDRITEQVAGALQPSIRIAEIERSRRKCGDAVDACAKAGISAIQNKIDF